MNIDKVNGREKKRILVITHELSLTGAPLALMDMIDICKKQGYPVDVISMEEGDLRGMLEEWDISVEIKTDFLTDIEGFMERCRAYGLIVVNTLLAFPPIYILNLLPRPVLWWMHEAERSFIRLDSYLPDIGSLRENIHIHVVGHGIQDVIRERYHREVPVLPFGVRDVPRRESLKGTGMQVRFLAVGYLSEVKGSDLLLRAICMLEPEELVQTEFVFCGNQENCNPVFLDAAIQLKEMIGNVRILPQMPHDELLTMMEQYDCLIVASRIETMSVVAVEMMMKEGVCLVSDACGIARYIEDGVNGYVFQSRNAAALAEKLRHVILHREEWEEVRRRGRATYETYFSMEVFEEKVTQLLEEYMYPNEVRMRELAAEIRKIRRDQQEGRILLSEEEKRQLSEATAMVQKYVDDCDDEEVGKDWLGAEQV